LELGVPDCQDGSFQVDIIAQEPGGLAEPKPCAIKQQKERTERMRVELLGAHKRNLDVSQIEQTPQLRMRVNVRRGEQRCPGLLSH
jgi:hypothetical protein